MVVNTDFANENLFEPLMNILTNVTIHKDADNKYSINSKCNDIVVTFLISGSGLDVYVSIKDTVFPLKDYKLDLSPSCKDKLLRQLNQRIQNKTEKKLTKGDFDKLAYLLKQQYTNAGARDTEKISDTFKRALTQTFDDIVGKTDYIHYTDMACFFIVTHKVFFENLKRQRQQRKTR